MVKRNERNDKVFETSSPFEAGASNKTLADTSNSVHSLAPGRDLTARFNPSFDAKRYTNPAGMPGVALVQRNGEKMKLPWKGGK
jgi:hypothetical protein